MFLKKYLGDAVLTACYLINCMPSFVLNKVPYSILYPHQSLHSLPPHIVWSTCFVHNVNPRLDNLSARSRKCVFLGYNRSQKGYKCYSPSFRRYFVLANVTFFEYVPYYGSSTKFVSLLS